MLGFSGGVGYYYNFEIFLFLKLSFFFGTGHRVLQAAFFNPLLTFVLMKIFNPVL
jgi:hypothetical protein